MKDSINLSILQVKTIFLITTKKCEFKTIFWSLCYPRLRDGFNILKICKNIENELRVYLSRRVAFKLPKLNFLYVVLKQ